MPFDPRNFSTGGIPFIDDTIAGYLLDLADQLSLDLDVHITQSIALKCDALLRDMKGLHGTGADAATATLIAIGIVTRKLNEADSQYQRLVGDADLKAQVLSAWSRERVRVAPLLLSCVPALVLAAGRPWAKRKAKAARLPENLPDDFKQVWNHLVKNNALNHSQERIGKALGIRKATVGAALSTFLSKKMIVRRKSVLAFTPKYKLLTYAI